MVNPFIESASYPELNLAKVESLRISDNGAWDVDLVKDLFSPKDQRLIFSIPLSRYERDDKWMWGEERNGVYSVKSGYKLLLNTEEFRSIPESINWKLIWKLKVPAKIRNFLWRTLSLCLPTLTALKRRMVDVEEWCPLCHHETEDDFHVLLDCPFARSVWCFSPMSSNVSSWLSVLEWWQALCDQGQQQLRECAAIILWCLWQNRNQVVWNGRGKSAQAIFQDALNLYDYTRCNSMVNAGVDLPHQQLGSRIWLKPPPGFVKCNVDAAVNSNSSHFGYGCVVCNPSGVVVHTIYGTLYGYVSPTLAEALSVREALSWLKSLNCSKIILESDALVVIEALNNMDPDFSSFGIIIDDRKFLCREFSSCQFVLVYRSANQAAHALVREGVSKPGVSERAYPSLSLISTVSIPDLV